jgi:uncharacterized protein YlxW (UPF0749 family)
MEEKILREILATTKENNDILRSLNMQRRWTNTFWAFKWLVIIILAYGAYQAASPYIEQAQNTYTQAQDALNSINSLNQQAQQLQNNIQQKNFTDFLKTEIQKRISP